MNDLSITSGSPYQPLGQEKIQRASSASEVDNETKATKSASSAEQAQGDEQVSSDLLKGLNAYQAAMQAAQSGSSVRFSLEELQAMANDPGLLSEANLNELTQELSNKSILFQGDDPHLLNPPASPES